MRYTGRGIKIRYPFLLLVLIFMSMILPEGHAFSEQDLVIVIDAGHGGQDTGVVGPGGLTEKEVCLDLAGRVKSLIDKGLGYRTFLTRSRDEALSLTERSSLANNNRGTLYVSIHLSGFPDQTIQGFGLFYIDQAYLAPGSAEQTGNKLPLWDRQQIPHIKESRRLADTLHQVFVQRFPGQTDLGVHAVPIYPFATLGMPSVLIEPAALTSPVQEGLLRQDNFREEIANAIYEGIRLFVKQVGSGAGHE